MVGRAAPVTGTEPGAPAGDLPALYRSLAELLHAARRVVLISHRAPDGDSVGSALALGNVLRALGKEVTLACPDPVPPSLRFLDGWERFVTTLDAAPAADVVMAVDCADVSQMGGMGPFALAATSEATSKGSGAGEGSGDRPASASVPARPLVNFDHHRSNTRYGSVNVIDAEAASVAEMVYWLLEALGMSVAAGPPAASWLVPSAQALLTGILNDTHSFQNANTTPQALRIAAILVEAGADAAAINAHLFRSRRLQAALLWPMVLETLEITDNGRVATALVTATMLEVCGADPRSDTDGLVDFLSDIIGVDLAILIKQSGPAASKASVRTSAAVDAVALVKQFGGGGHSRAAGCDVPAAPAAARAALLAAYRGLSGATHGEVLPM
jgi:phosphoesterase RecJ-like protein